MLNNMLNIYFILILVIYIFLLYSIFSNDFIYNKGINIFKYIYDVKMDI